MRLNRLISTAGLLGMTGIGTPALAQHVLSGRVLDSTMAVLSGVEVLIPDLSLTATTDALGRYRLTGIPAGEHRILLRRLGYLPLEVSRRFAGDSVVLYVQLMAAEVVLPTLETTAKGPEAVPIKLREWARRREYNVSGKFWDDSLLRTLEHRNLADVLQPVSGVRIFRFRGGLYLVTAGGRAGTTGSAQTNIPDFPKQCYAQVYLDGARLRTPADLNNIPVNQIAAMEFYRSASEIPVELNAQGSMCGVLAVWTR